MLDDSPNLERKSESVYKSMKEDPAYGGEGKTFLDFKHNIGGYKMAEVKDGQIRAIGGESGEVPYLEIGQAVKFNVDFPHSGQLDMQRIAQIVEIVDPEIKGSSKIVRLKQGERTAWFRPDQLQLDYSPKPLDWTA